MMSSPWNRRRFLSSSISAAVVAAGGQRALQSRAQGSPQEPGERPQRDPADGVEVIHPGGQIPVSFIIDDSTCLVNMAHFCMPQFAEAWGGERYDKPWRDWPREIPDSFVRRFGEFCREEGVKGKYSVVPYPACVGWLDRELPGWSAKQLRESLSLVRDFMTPDWDIHPEMISHTRVIDLQTGRPLPVKADGTYWMENGGWDNGRSVDEVAAYIAYALQVLKNVDLPCAGFTTPGGFGNGGKGELSRAGLQAVRSVFGTEVPHYFKYVVTEPGESTQPRVEFASGLTSDAPECIVNVPACTGDWFGGWDATSVSEIGPSIDRFITTDFQSGRLVEVIGSGEPAAFLCHWPGLYCHGSENGFRIFQGVVKRVNQAYGDRIRWMKLSEIARYWAAKELTAWMRGARTLDLRAPFACDGFTMKIATKGEPKNVRMKADENLSRVQDADRPLKRGLWRTTTGKDGIEVCFDLPKGVSQLRWE